MVGIGQQHSFSISKVCGLLIHRAVELFKINSAQPMKLTFLFKF